MNEAIHVELSLLTNSFKSFPRRCLPYNQED
jgi:hypothetical protein